jgi:hypothetical protein
MDNDLDLLRKRLRLRFALASESYYQRPIRNRQPDVTGPQQYYGNYMDGKACRQRLLTFTLERWPKRPRRCDAREAAGRGWTCTGSSRLECSECGALLYQPPDVLDKAADQSIVIDVYAEQLRTAHQADCSWRRFHCPSDIFDSCKLAPAVDRATGLCTFGCSASQISSSRDHRYWCVFSGRSENS